MRGKKPFVVSASREADDSSADDAFEANPQHLAAKKRVQQTQAQVDEVVGIMTESIAKVLERDQKLLELDDRADALEMHASQFEQSAGKLKNKFWLQNIKMLVALGLVFIILVAIIVYQFV